MPIIKDMKEEYDHFRIQNHGLSKAELRKSNKPIMEKRRRARINNCLNELKTLILDAMKKDPARHSKLEKADILEMTVKHLQSVQRQQLSIAVASDPSVLGKFKTGFSDCAVEINRYISRLDGVDKGVKQRLLGHLTTCVSGLNQVTPFSFPPPPTPVPSVSHQSTPNILEDVNNNEASTRLQMISSGIQVIPSRLPTGELALLLPGSSKIFSSPPEVSSSESSSSDRVSAFTIVEQKKVKSPQPSPTSSTEGEVLGSHQYLSPHNSDVSSTSTPETSLFKVPNIQIKSSAPKSYFSPYTNESSLLMKAPSLPQTNNPCGSSVIYRPLITTLGKPHDLKRPHVSVAVDVDVKIEEDKKDPLDFSMKKMMKTPLTDLPCNVPLQKIIPKNQNDGETRTSSASSASTSTTLTNESSRESMWRPW